MPLLLVKSNGVLKLFSGKTRVVCLSRYVCDIVLNCLYYIMGQEQNE